MKSMTVIAISLLMTFALTTATPETSAKLRRDGVLNMYPFPRVGRSYWRVPLEDELEHKPSKKSSLYAFPRVGRNDEQLRNQMLYQMRSEPTYLRSEPGGYRQPANLNRLRNELTQIHPELGQIRNELAQMRPDLSQFFSNLAQNQQGSSINRNYAQSIPGLSQSRSQFLQSCPNFAQFQRELSDFLENVFGKLKGRGLTKRDSEIESEGDAGMWFGPRLGRSDKSIEYDESSEKNNVITISPAIINSEQNRERVKRKI